MDNEDGLMENAKAICCVISAKELAKHEKEKQAKAKTNIKRDNPVAHPEHGWNWYQGVVMADDASFGYGGYIVASGSTLDTTSPRDQTEDLSSTSLYHRDYHPQLAEDEHMEVTMDSMLHSSMVEKCNNFLSSFQWLPEDQWMRILQEMHQMQQQGSAEASTVAARP